MGERRAPAARNGTAAPRAHKRPVLLVHGILGQRHVYWNLFKRRLVADGFRVHEVILPYALLGDIRIAARMLADKVDATLAGDKADRVDIICHSAGGLVARYYVTYLKGNRNVRHIVTLGTPHGGTYFSYLLQFPFLSIVRQTRPGSHLIQEISGPGAIPQGVKVTSLWSPTDLVVLPPESAVLAGATNIKVPWTTHWGFLWNKHIYHLVKDALTGHAEGQRTLDQGTTG
ncbi:MAG: triacylglycerol lipase [Thermoplasmata archaeon]|nr:triacylglycerol lipase [Thermoplasmata archaeon]MEA3166693.1 triacylglycerol lipase [Thermoplasmata archaeon]